MPYLSTTLAECHPNRKRDSRYGLCKPCATKYRAEERRARGRRADAKRRADPVRWARKLANNRAARQRAKAKDPYLWNRNKRLQSKYGIRQTDYERMYAEQDGRCASCGNPYEKLVIDHDHKTGAVRKLLCNGCNSGIGYFHEDTGKLLAAIEYLKSFAN